jgi:hypothetical protein
LVFMAQFMRMEPLWTTAAWNKPGRNKRRIEDVLNTVCHKRNNGVTRMPLVWTG